MHDDDDADASATFMNKYEIRLVILSLIFIIFSSLITKKSLKIIPK